MNWRMFYKIFTLMLCLCACGCQSIETRGKHVCCVFAESTEATAIVKELPISGLEIAVIPVPILSNDDIASASIISGQCGTMLDIHLTDKAAYELCQIAIDLIGRRLLLEYDGNVIGFSQISGENVRSFIFIPEVSNDVCQTFCRFINSRKR